MLTEFIFYRMSYTLEFGCIFFNYYSLAACKIKSFSTEVYMESVVSYYISFISIYCFSEIKKIYMDFYSDFEWLYIIVLYCKMSCISLARMTMINAEERSRMWILPWRIYCDVIVLLLHPH